MALNPVATVNISLQTTAISQAGFGTPMFIASHRAFQSRVRSYASPKDVAADFSTDSDPYIASVAFFANTPSGPLFKVGRREADATLTPDSVSTGTVYEAKLTVNDGDFIDLSYEAGIAETQEEVVDEFISQIESDLTISAHVSAAKVGTSTDAVLVISANTSSDVFTISSLENLDESYSGTESGADTLNAILEEDEDFYFVTAEMDETFREQVGDEVEASNRLAVGSTNRLDYIDNPAVSPATLSRSVAIWHEEADKFPELQWIGVNAPYSPDTNAVTWAGNRLSLFAESKDPRTGNKLTSTQQTNLKSWGVNLIALVGGIPVTRSGKVLNGEWIDTIRGRDTMVARITERVTGLILNQQGGKIPYTAAGISQIDSALTSALQPFVDSNFLESFVTNPPLISSISAAQKQSRVLDNVRFTAYLAGAIHEVVFYGVLTISEE